MGDVIAYASVLTLNRHDVKILSIKDSYALHKVVFGLFEDVRSEVEKRRSVPSGIVYADKGGDFNTRKILILSTRKPHKTPQFGKVETKTISADFLSYDRYSFQITINPGKRDIITGKIVPITGSENILQWFMSRSSESWGFSVKKESLELERTAVQSFEKAGQRVTHGSATIKGELAILERDRFSESFLKGIGRGRSFGFGLLQIVPIRCVAGTKKFE